MPSFIESQKVDILKHIEKDISSIKKNIALQTKTSGADQSPYHLDRLGANKKILHGSASEGDWKKVYDFRGRLR